MSLSHKVIREISSRISLGVFLVDGIADTNIGEAIDAKLEINSKK